LKPNILFLVLDALPAKICFESSPDSKTPHIKKLMNNGISFKQTISCGDETPISFASMFTSKFPFNAGIRPSLWKYKLKSENYIQILKKHGYKTYATLPKMSAWKEIFSDLKIDYYISHTDRLFNGLGEKVIKKIKDDKSKEPWFYLVHLMDSHKPIYYPKEFDSDKFGIDDYERMISYVDSWIGKFLENIDIEKTLIILCSDHGDYVRRITNKGKTTSFEYKTFANPTKKIKKITPSILEPTITKLLLKIRTLITNVKLMKIGRELTPFEKRALTGARTYTNHFLFDELIHVPLIISGLGLEKNKEINEMVGLIDIFPTICDIINVNDTIMNKDGKSLLPLIKNKNFQERPIYSETSLNLKNSEEGGYGIRTSKYKFFTSSSQKNKKIHLYDLQNDPLEEINLAKSHTDIVQVMEKLLKDLRNSVKNENEKEFIKRKIAKKRKNLLSDLKLNDYE